MIDTEHLIGQNYINTTMWNYLKSDFEELLNVVKEDSNVILEKLHDESKVAPNKKATAASQEAARRMFLEETYLVPLLLEDDDADELMDDAERERVEQFLHEFKIDDQTDDISQLLSRPDGIVREYFEALVPHEIPYEDFWRRYYYRCDEIRIQTAWDAQEVAAQQARAELVGSVSSFLGGAAKSLALTVKEVVAQKDGRPPFVMNTAVDEDSDDEEEEEEELGWDDEDEEEEEGVAINKETAIITAVADPLLDDSADTEQIEFHIDDETLNKTKEELKQAVLERDQLQQTVALLKKELVTANSNVTAAASDKIPSESSVDVTVLKEKDAEIESLKASLAQMTASAASSSTSTLHDVAVANAKVQELTEALAAKDLAHEATTSALQDEIISLRVKLATSEAAALDDAEGWKVQMDQSSATIASLTTQLTDLQTKWELAQSEIRRLRADAAEDRIHQDSGDKTSEDSGVPVEAPPPVVAARMPKRGGNKASDDEDGETSDGWGDEW
jgi:BSD domain